MPWGIHSSMFTSMVATTYIPMLCKQRMKSTDIKVILQLAPMGLTLDSPMATCIRSLVGDFWLSDLGMPPKIPVGFLVQIRQVVRKNGWTMGQNAGK